MKKFTVIILIIIFLLSGCGSSKLERISDADYVVIIWDADSKARVNGMMEMVYNDFTGITLEETENNDATLYTLEFFNESDKLIFSLNITEGGLICFGGKNYKITDGSLNTGWIETIINKSSGPPSAN